VEAQSNKPRQTSPESPESPYFFPESPGFPEKSPEKKSGYSALFPGVSGVSGEKVRILRVFSRRKARSKILAFEREKRKKAKLDQTTSKNHEI
jgi:hypothetical protein